MNNKIKINDIYLDEVMPARIAQRKLLLALRFISKFEKALNRSPGSMKK